MLQASRCKSSEAVLSALVSRDTGVLRCDGGHGAASGDLPKLLAALGVRLRVVQHSLEETAWGALQQLRGPG